MTPRPDSPRALIRYTLVGLALTVAISAIVYLVLQPNRDIAVPVTVTVTEREREPERARERKARQ